MARSQYHLLRMGRPMSNGSGGTTPTPAPVFPTALTAGYQPAMGALTNSTGIYNTLAVGEIIELKNFQVGHYVRIQHNNVTMRKCVMLAGDVYDIRVMPGVTGFLLEDCTIDNTAVGPGLGGGNGIMGHDMTVRRCKFIKCENNVATDGGNVLIEGNFCDDMATTDSGRHPDCIQVDGGYANITIQNNTLLNDNDQTSSVMLDNVGGPLDNVKVIGNKLGGGSFTLYVDDQFTTAGNITRVVISDNVFAFPGVAGYAVVKPTVQNNVTWTNNTQANGTQIPKP